VFSPANLDFIAFHWISEQVRYNRCCFHHAGESFEAYIPRNVPRRQWNVAPCWKFICTLMAPDRISEELDVRKGTFGSDESWEGFSCAKNSRNAGLTWHFQGESLLNGENRGREPSGHPVQLSK
jgi:hypothetical protein